MLTERKLGESTYAEGREAIRPRSAEDGSYVAAEPGQSTRLVFPGPRMQLRTQIHAGGRTYSLSGVFVIQIDYLDDADVFAYHRTLAVHGYGKNQDKALAAFCESFDFQWRNLVDVPEDALTPGGKRRRAALEAAVESVSEA